MNRTIAHLRAAAGLVAALSAPVLVACHGGAPAAATSERAADSLATTLRPTLPTGLRLDPAGTFKPVGQFPLAMVPSPDGERLVLMLSGYNDQGVQVLDRATGEVTQTLLQPAGFIGIAFAPDGRTLYASGGNQDVVYRYAWADGAATLRDSLVLAVKAPKADGTRYPAGVGVSPDGRFVYAAENLADSLAVIDVESGKVVQRLATERYPYGVAVAPDGAVYVSAWGGNTVSIFAPGDGGRLQQVERMPVARHPSALLLNRDGSRLFVASGSTDQVAVVDTRTRKVIRRLHDAPPTGPAEGSTPNGLALDEAGTRLFVAEADANAVALFDLSSGTSGIAGATGDDRLVGRVPTDWYPTAVHVSGDTIRVIAGKGRGSLPNPRGTQPTTPDLPNGRRIAGYTLSQLSSGIDVSLFAHATGPVLEALTKRVTHADRWDVARSSPHGAYPPIEHVVYIIKENRTYDQVLGDLTEADGDTSLLFFPRTDSPNHHALAERFGIYDRFFVNAEISADGHSWSTAAYVSDYDEKTLQSVEGRRGRNYDYEGINRVWSPAGIPDDDVNEPANGYLWDLAARKGLSMRNYGEYVIKASGDGEAARYIGTKPALRSTTVSDYPGFNMDIPDQHRADIWIRELEKDVKRGAMPALEIVRLPNDHTSYMKAGKPSPRAAMADNDLALGRIIEALSKTKFWRNTAVFVMEDDAQNGPDHVDSHRSVMLVISPWAKGGVSHRFANTTDVLRTMEEILGLDALAQFDFYGRPLREIWATQPDVRPYVALVPANSLDEKNPPRTSLARESARVALDREDEGSDAVTSRILWRGIKGNAPWPGVRRMPALEARRSE